MLYPLNSTLFNQDQDLVIKDTKLLNQIINIVNSTDLYAYDRISIDRRLDITKPLSTTRFKINEFYENDPVETYKEAEKIGIEKIINLTKTTTGDILFFSISKNKIKDIVTELNNSNMPSNWIALPYYSELSKKWQNIIDNIDKKKNIDINRADIFLAIENEEYRKVDSNTYTQVIIVSTNIAEASITINTLRVVVDIGYKISVSYDPILRITKNEESKITEASRKQRKGRVGRTAPGSVYYIYQENSRKNVENIYPITQTINTLIYNLCKLIYTNPDNNKLSRIDFFNENIKKQYFDDYSTNNIQYNSYYNGTSIVRPYYQIQQLTHKYETGYDIDTIYDFKGTFYLIHPFEHGIQLGNYNIKLIRNEFTGKFNRFPSKIKKEFIKQFDELFKLRLITIERNLFTKTQLFKLLDDLQIEITNIIGEISMNELWTLILGMKYNVINEICWINTILEFDIEKLSHKFTDKNKKERADPRMLIETFGSRDSDLLTYVNIFKKLEFVLPTYDFYIPTDDDKKTFTISQTNIYKNIENKKKKDTLKSIQFLRNEEITKETNNKIKIFCNQFGLDDKEILKLINRYNRKLQVIPMLHNWVQLNQKYIPYFRDSNNLSNILLIYISAYSNLTNIDDTTETSNIKKDQISIVKGSYIHSIKKEKRDNNIILKHLTNFNHSIHTKALLPALIYPLKKQLLTWNDVYLLYKSTTPSMLEEYLLPEDEKNNQINIRNKVFNQSLLELFTLFRANQ